jgi:hypothetical protein
MIAEKRSALELDIPSSLYDEWMKTLIETIETKDPGFDEQVALAWRLAFAPGLAVMRHYSAINSVKPESD